MPEEIKSVGLIGLGAVGSVIAAPILSREPGSLYILADPARQRRYEQEGVFFNGKRLPLRFPEHNEPLDLILFATKTTSLAEAMETAAPFIGPRTLILSLLNGISSEQVLGERFGASRVLYGYFLGHTSTRTGNRIHQDGTYFVYFGDKINNIWSEEVTAVSRFFTRTGVRFQIPGDMESARWQKFVLNVGCNQATALLRCPYGHLQHSAPALALIRELMDEAAAVAYALGIEEADRMAAEGIRLLHTLDPSDKSSMLQDVEAGRPTEVEDFAGAVVHMAESLGVDTPLNRAALQILRALR